MSGPLRLLIVEDSPEDALLMVRELRWAGYDVADERVETAEALQAALKRQAWDIVLSDYSLPGFNGLEALKLVQEHDPDLPFILLSGMISEEMASDIMHSGAHDFIIKGRWARLVPAVERELAEVVVRKERRQAGKNLELFRMLLDRSNDAIEVIDPKTGRFLDVNEKACLALGYSREEYLSLKVFDVVPNLDPALFAKNVEGSRKPGFTTVEDVHRRKDGTMFPVEVGLNYVQLDRDYLLSVVRDITERKRAEDSLRQSEARYRSYVDVTGQIGWVTNADGEVVEDLPSLRKFSGQTYEEAKGLGWTKAIHPDDLERTLKVWNQAVASKSSYETEYRMRRHDGVYRDLLARGFPVFGAGGSVREWVGTCIDISERKQAEAALQAQLERLSALRSIDLAITGSFNLKMILSVIAEQTVEQLRADAATILLFNSYAFTLEYGAGCGLRGGGMDQFTLHLGEGIAGRAALEQRSLSVPDLAAESSCPVRGMIFSSEGFVSHQVTPLVAKGQVKGVLEVFHRRPFTPTENWMEFFHTLATQAAIAIDNASMFADMQRSQMELSLAYEATIEGWSRALDLRDKDTEWHTQRVTEMTVRLARRMGIPESEIVHIRRGSLLHDMGKIGVPDSILNKQDKLTDEEWAVMRCHPQIATDMIAPIAYLRPALDIPASHHEKWDGTGYPRGLKGERIPLAARIFAVVDVWDALRSNRPYRDGWPEVKVLEYIRTQAGAHFDPKVVEMFFRVMGDKD